MKPSLHVAYESTDINQQQPPLQTGVLSVVYTGSITHFDEDSKHWLLDDQFLGVAASSLILKLGIGDRVCFVEDDGQYYITQVLSQPLQDDNTLVFESEHAMEWRAPQLRFSAWKELEFMSLNRLSLVCKHGVVSSVNSLVMQAEQLIQHVTQFSVTAKGLLRLNGKQQLITAEEDVRIDGKRINMG